MKKHKQLHRVAIGTHSDWDAIPNEERSLLQKIAARTYGIITPGTAVTVIGFYLVFTGLLMFTGDDQLLGTAYVFVGRWMDAFDGAVAHTTRTKSTVGAAIDVGVDSLLLIAALVLLVSYSVLPLAAAIMIALPKSLNAISSLSAKIRNKRLYPTGASKLGTAMLWFGIGCFMVFALLLQVISSPVRLDILGWLLLVVGLVLTIPSTLYYISVGFGINTQDS